MTMLTVTKELGKNIAIEGRYVYQNNESDFTSNQYHRNEVALGMQIAY